MSATVESTGSYADCDEFIDYQIQQARTRIKWTDVLTASLMAGVLLVGYILVFTVLDHWVVAGGFSDAVRGAMLVLVLTVCAGIVYRYVIRPWTREIHPLYAASMLDRSGTELDGTLLSLVDLNTTGSSIPDNIRQTIEKRAAVRLSEINVDEAIDRRWLMKLGIMLFVLVVLTCLYAIFSPKSISLIRPLTITESGVATTTRILKVQPGSDSIDAGQQVEVSVDLAGTIPEEVIVQYTTADKTYVNESLTMQAAEDEGRFRVLMVGDSNRGLRQDLTYRVIAGDAISPDYNITVTQPPRAEVVRVDYDYPDYMTLPPRTSAGGNIDVWEGTKVRIQAQASVPLKFAVIRFSDDPGFSAPAEDLRLAVNETSVSGTIELKLREDGTSPKYYRIEVQDESGREDPSPTIYTVNVRPDRAPEVRLLDPIRDLKVPANAVIPVLVSAKDPDFLLRSVELHYEVNGEARAPERLFDGTRRPLQKTWSGTWEFDLGILELRDGDVVRYYATARDNKPLLGSQSRTGVLQFLLTSEVSPEEARKRLQESKERQQQQHAGDQKSRDEQTDPSESDPNNSSAESRQDGDSASETETGKGDSEKAGGRNTGDAASEPAEGQKSGGDGERGTDGDGTSGNEPNTQSGSQASDDGSGSKSGEQGGRQNPAMDDEALQKLMERYRKSAAGEEDDRNAGEDGGDVPQGSSTAGQDGANADAGRSETTAGDEGSNSDSPSKEDERSAASDRNSKDRSDDPGSVTDGVEKSGDNTASDNEGTPNSAAAGDSEDAADRMSQENESDTTDAASSDDAMQKDGGEGASDGTSGKTPDQEVPGPADQSGQQNGQDGQSGKQDGQSGQQGEPESQQGGQSGQQDGQSGQQGGQSGQQGGQSGQQGGQSGQQGGQSGQQGGQSGQQGGQSGQQGGQSGQQGGQSGQQGGQTGQQGGQSGQQGGQSGQQGGQSGQQGGQSGQQGGQSGQQDGQSGKQGGQSGQQGGQSGQQGGQSGQQGGQSGQQGGQSGQQGGQSGQQGGQSGQQGGQSGQQGGQSGQQGGQSGQQGGQSGQQGGQSGQQGGQSGQQGGSAKGTNGGVGSESMTPKQPGAGGQGGANDGPEGGGQGGGTGGSEFKADDPSVRDAAQAADLVLKRLKKDLERNNVDQDLLDELGWTEDRLKDFSHRMQKQLNSLKEQADDAPTAKELQRRRVEEMLRSLDLKSSSTGRVGDRSRDIEQQDTTLRKGRAPAQYRDLLEMYQKSLSEGRRR